MSHARDQDQIVPKKDKSNAERQVEENEERPDTSTGTLAFGRSSPNDNLVVIAAQDKFPIPPNISQGFGINIPTADQDPNDEIVELCPPINFAMVAPGIYRSGMPKKKNFGFLRQLGLRSILTLILEEYPPMNANFIDENGIKYLQFGMSGNKEPFVDIDEEVMNQALLALLDKRNHPILVHCNKGKHRTGCLIGCLRKFQHWSHTSIFDEYRRFSFPKSRAMDQQFIEMYDPRPVWDQAKTKYLPNWPTL
ncbi:tyrosine-protein phosphatase siw14 [Mycoemilia scoparia]|uniref:diphosphoinositol-polyphosphate diphosphatase n=1 Tax=Mycoemilia scoparia TaxID=417184 RepID=A0A9W8DQZ8_9FUNG|nr:tyrosine-protein phosphatase siw14 [Mycoemilia scoparia]